MRINAGDLRNPWNVVSRFAAACAFVLLALGPATAESGEQEKIGGVSVEEALELGERMYVHGILPSGKPMQAMVQGDIPVEGSKFTCANCHQRSGFGSGEGTIKTPPIDGTRLYEPTSQFKGIPLKKHPVAADGQTEQSFRPAYTDETLPGCSLRDKTLRAGRSTKPCPSISSVKATWPSWSIT